MAGLKFLTIFALCALSLLTLECLPAHAQDEGLDQLISDMRNGAKRPPYLRPPEYAQTLDKLVAIGSPAVRPLIEILKNDPNYCTRGTSATLLGRIGDPSAVDALGAALADFTWKCDYESYVGEAAARALGQFRDDPRVVPLLIGALPRNRAAARVLVEFRDDPRVVPLLIQALQKDNHYAAEALGEIKDPRSVGPLIAALNRPGYVNEDLLTNAAEALGKIKDVRALAPLVQLAGEGRPPINSGVSRALKQFGSLAISPLITALSVSRTQQGAADALEYFGPSAVDPLLAAAKSQNRLLRFGAADLLARPRLSWASCGGVHDECLLSKQREETLFLGALKTRDWAVIAGGISFYIGRSDAGTEQLLVEALNRAGNTSTAETLLNSKNPQLEAAARAWAKSRNASIYQTQNSAKYYSTWRR